jgi:hypothetical protein
LVLGAGQHDAGYSNLHFEHMGREIRRFLDAAYAAGWRRVMWQVRFCRYRFCPTGELNYRGAVG